MDPQNIPARLVEPREDEDLMLGRDAVKPIQKLLVQVKPCIGRSFGILQRRLRARFERRSNIADQPNGDVVLSHSKISSSPQLAWCRAARTNAVKSSDVL